ncbi:hypothetical protein NE865_01954 [Phthorimaea operculella]|nr:hypothetical protein NE865_01954 [Phthorimaea operculella]
MAQRNGKAIKNGKVNLMNSYYLYAALLSMKLLAYVPVSCLLKSSSDLAHASLADLKDLVPFWIAGYLYITTKPDAVVCLTLLRAFFIARLTLAVSYAFKIPQCYVNASQAATYMITVFMASTAVYQYVSSF